MKGKLLCAVAGLVGALVLLAGCFNPLGGQREADSQEQGAVVLVFKDVRAKTLVPEISLEIARFEVSFTRAGFQPVLMPDIPGDTTHTDPVSLLAGPWELAVTAFNDDGDIIGVGSDALQVRARQTATVSLPIGSLSGAGTLALSADLSELELLSPGISGSLTCGATQEVIPIQLGIEDSLGMYEGSLEAGSYLVSLQLAEGETVIARYVDSVLIVQEERTAGALLFRPGSGSVMVELVDEITRPIVITLQGLQESLGSEETMTVTASTAVAVDSYRWYLDGEEQGGEESAQVTLGAGLEEGPYLLTVVVEKGGIYSSQQGVFTVVTGPYYAIGDVGPAGGHIFYVDLDDAFPWTYLEAAPASTEWTGKPWGGWGLPLGPYAQGTAVGTGRANTEFIVWALGDLEPHEHRADYAAKLCADLVCGDYDDWFLPSKDELNLMYENLHLRGIGGFEPVNDTYWSSSEYIGDGEGSASFGAWGHNFWEGYPMGDAKDNNLEVRAVRAF